MVAKPLFQGRDFPFLHIVECCSRGLFRRAFQPFLQTGTG
jgi:hypothetical protein